MKKLSIITLSMILSFGSQASTVYEYDDKNLKEVYNLEKEQFKKYVIKFKDKEIHKDLKKIPELAKTSENRIYGLSVLQEIENKTGLSLIHSRSSILNMDEILVKKSNKNIIEVLMATGYFEFVEESKKLKTLDYKKRKIENNIVEYKTNDLDLGKYNDTFWSLQTHLDDRESPNLGLSNIEKAKDATVNNLNRKLRIAVIDSGSYPHEDMVFLDQGYDFTTITGEQDEDGNDLPKFRDNDPTEADSLCVSGHGLAVSSLISAISDNSKGIVGAMDTKNVDIIPIKAMTCKYDEEGKEDTTGSLLDISTAIYWAAGGEVEGVPDIIEPADVINLSLGGEAECNEVLQTTINYAVENNILVVAAAGNESTEAKNVTPANCNNVITTASVSLKGDLSEFSNFGEAITSSVIGEDWVLPYIDTKLHEEAEGGYTKTEYGEWDGTSFSSPAMSVIVGNVRLKYPEMSIVEVIELLSRTSNKAEISNESDTDDSSDSNSGTDENSSEELEEAPQCKEKGCGAGIADAYNVLTALDDRTNVHEGSIKHKYEGYNSLPEYKYLLELDKSTSVSSCDLYVARWGLLTQEYENIKHRVYISTSDDEKLTSSNSNLQKIIDYPYSIIEAKPEERIGVQICEGSYCGEIFELDKPEDDIPVYCESYITD